MHPKKTIEDMIALAGAKGGNCLSDEYTNARTKLLWECQHGHRWETTPAIILQGGWCPDCAGRSVPKDKCLQMLNPELAEQWHPAKNNELNPRDVAAGSGRKVWWRCGRGHEWEAIIGCRNRGSGCPYCSGFYASKENNLQTLNPELAKQWLAAKNGTLTPADVTVSSNKKVWWRCGRGHEWEAIIGHRSKGAACPYCTGRYATKETCLQTLNPELAKQWHPAKNGELTPKDVKTGSGRKAWWRCSQGHEWETAVVVRSQGHGCPYCAGVRKLESTP